MQAVHWTMPTESGLGDRLVDVAQLLAFSRVFKRPLYMQWPRFQSKDIDTAHRATDILKENVVNYLRLPKDLFLEPNRNADMLFKHTIGGLNAPETFHAAHLQGNCSIDEYKTHYKAVLKDFGFNDDINAFLSNTPKEYVSLHVRRGDKVRPVRECHTLISHNELDELNALTYRALDYYIEKGYKTFYICSDQDDKKKEFVDYVESKGLTTFSLPGGLEKWQTTYYDLAVMSRSQHIVTSMPYSAFSMFAAMIGNGSIDTAYSLREKYENR
jgi:hypothetical protein